MSVGTSWDRATLMTRRRVSAGGVARGRPGFSFLEVMIMLLIAAVALPVTLVTLSGLSVRTARMAHDAQALQLAHELMEEIVSRRFDEMAQPDAGGKWTQPANFVPEGGETARDDVDDYYSDVGWNGWNGCRLGFAFLCGYNEWEHLTSVTLGSHTYDRWVQVHYVPRTNFGVPETSNSTTTNFKRITVRVLLGGYPYQAIAELRAIRAAYQD